MSEQNKEENKFVMDFDRKINLAKLYKTKGGNLIGRLGNCNVMVQKNDYREDKEEYNLQIIPMKLNENNNVSEVNF